jgi:GNAT superfamily N-acetyltransferase
MWLNWQERHAKENQVVREDVARQMWRSNRLQQPPMQYWLAYVGEKPVGYCASFVGVGGVGQVENLFTHSDFRLLGIAKSLIFHCVQRCRTEGAGPVVIAADPTDTPKHIYAALGFHPVAVLSQYLKRLDD